MLGYVIATALGFGVGTAFGSMILSDAKKYFSEGVADLKTFIQTELATLKTKL